VCSIAAASLVAGLSTSRSASPTPFLSVSFSAFDDDRGFLIDGEGVSSCPSEVVFGVPLLASFSDLLECTLDMVEGPSALNVWWCLLFGVFFSYPVTLA
jgi:hypothetical protein